MQRDQVRVSQDADRLDSSRDQLTKDRQTLGTSQQQSKQAAQAPQQALPTINLNRAVENPSRAQQQQLQLPADLVTPKPQVNTLGQTIGKFINISA